MPMDNSTQTFGLIDYILVVIASILIAIGIIGLLTIYTWTIVLGAFLIIVGLVIMGIVFRR